MPISYEFPKDFLWGTAMSAFQTEGNNKNTEWWEWENSRPPKAAYPKEKSGIACDSYNRYEEDFDLCKKLNNNAIRISIEWARIQPKEDVIDQNEIEHYKKVLEAARSRGLKTFVTLYHFTLPAWLAKKGGWKNFKSPKYFADYTKLCAKEFGDLVDVFLTLNEPLVYTTLSYVYGTWPPEKESILSAFIVQRNIIAGHKLAYRAIKSVGNYTVGIVKNFIWYDVSKSIWAPLDYLMTRFLMFFHVGLHLIIIRKYIDILGVNYYFTNHFKKLMRYNLDDVQSDLGWWIYPKGLENSLLYLKKFNIPMYITENGVADQMDRLRKDFIRDMLISCHNAMHKGADVRGYFYWSLIDNYEWHEGFWPKFGLVYINRNNNLKRVPRDSFYYYAEICRSGRILK